MKSHTRVFLADGMPKRESPGNKSVSNNQTAERVLFAGSVLIQPDGGMDDTQISLIMTNCMSELERLAPLVEQFGKCNCFTPKEIFQINLALDELITNIINYGYDDDKEHQIRLELTIEEDRLTMKLVDDAKPFNPLQAPEAQTHLPPEDRDRPVGGLGIELVRRLMDRISYEYRSGSNILTMEKHMNNPA